MTHKDTTILNLEQLNDVSCGDKEFEKELFDMFQEHFGGTFKKLKEALEKKDHANAVLYSHDIKGSSANLGGVGIKAVSEKMETLCKVFLYEEAAELLPVLEEEHKKMTSAFKSYLKELGLLTNEDEDSSATSAPSTT